MKILTPAYGADYTSATATRIAYFAGADFILNDITSPWNGKPCSSRNFINEEVKIRYANKRKFTFITFTNATR